MSEFVQEVGHLVEFTELGSTIMWQDGPVSEVGVTGDQPETLLPSIIKRLRHVGEEGGRNPDRYTALAITKCEEALHWLQARTADREARRVEGTREL